MPKILKRSSNTVAGIQKYFLLAVLLLLLATLFRFLSPFMTTIFMAAVIAAAVYPVKKYFDNHPKIPRFLSAGLLFLGVIVVVLIPLSLIFFSIVGQASDAYISVSGRVNEFIASDRELLSVLDRYPSVHDFVQTIIEVNPISVDDIVSSVGDIVGTVSSFLLENTTNLLRHLTTFILHAIVFLLGLFYFIKDGDKLIAYVHVLLPMSEKYRVELFHKLYNLMHSIIFGIFGSSIAQGALLGVGLVIVGAENVLFWSAIAAILSTVPYVGSAIVWGPFSVVLFLSGHIGMGIFLVIWSLVLVANVDNFVKPYLIGSKTSLHPFALLIVMLGGALAFGLQGLIFGPLVLTLTLAFLHIYQLEYKKVLDSSPFETEVVGIKKSGFLSRLRKK
ncbi:AI-2E family transporter [Patescibacteria group bacterium]|nr:AI-2E family transporter [Patescibacteria group bacterium]